MVAGTLYFSGTLCFSLHATSCGFNQGQPASMRPRSDERGRAAVQLNKEGYNMLQFGRVPMNAEGVQAHASTIKTVAASMRPRSDERGGQQVWLFSGYTG